MREGSSTRSSCNVTVIVVIIAVIIVVVIEIFRFAKSLLRKLPMFRDTLFHLFVQMDRRTFIIGKRLVSYQFSKIKNYSE